MTEIETLYETPWLKVQRIGHWDLVRRPFSDACVGILAITPCDEVVLVEQFRIPLQQRVVEIPAGIVGDEEEHRGEPLEVTAARELLEETGFRAGTVRLLAKSPTSPGLTPEFIHFYHATDLVQEHGGGGVEGEDIEVHCVPLRELRAWLADAADRGLAIDHRIHATLALAGIAF